MIEMDRTLAWWRVQLDSAFRTTIACAIVDYTTLYAPASLRKLLTYPAYSYLTTILIVLEATLGDSLSGFWHALYASIQVVILSTISLWVIGPARLNYAVATAFYGNYILAAAGVALSAFVVALPKSTPLRSKQIAFGQLVIVYVGTVVHGAQTGVIMHPVHVASNTILGALASVLAMLLPYPKLAFHKVRKDCQTYCDIAQKRLHLFVEAISSQDNPTALNYIFELQPLCRQGAKLLQIIMNKRQQKAMMWERPIRILLRCIMNKQQQEGMLWERLFLKPNCTEPRKKLEEIEIPLRGMEVALTSCSCPSFPFDMIDEGLKNVLQIMEKEIHQELGQVKSCAPFKAEETNHEITESVWNFKTISTNHKDLPAFLFLYCMELLQKNTRIIVERRQKSNAEKSSDSQNQAQCCCIRRIWNSLYNIRPCNLLVFAFKCSLSLCLAVLFGLMFNKKEAYWAGLTIAIGFNPKRQATFTASNARAQGTAMGSVYGILCSSIFRRSVNLMCLPLFPWIIFTSFLRHSRMYRSAGALSAVVGALLILGRKNYGSPIDFAISRTTEAFIGLICFIFVEILFHPIRSATLAKFELSHTLGTLRNCINAIVLCVSQTSMTTTSISPPTLGEQQKKLKSQVSELEKLIVHAKLEPNFWLLPFHAACYDKLLESLLKMVDILFFVTNTIESISQILQKSATSVDCEELLKRMNGDLQVFKEKYGSSLKCLQEVTMTKSSEVHEKKLQNNNTSQDIERGRSSTSEVHGDLCIADREGFLNSFLENSRQVVEKITNEGENLKSQMVLCSSVLAFCISSLMMETLEMKKRVKELVKWENSSSHTII